MDMDKMFVEGPSYAEDYDHGYEDYDQGYNLVNESGYDLLAYTAGGSEHGVATRDFAYQPCTTIIVPIETPYTPLFVFDTFNERPEASSQSQVGHGHRQVKGHRRSRNTVVLQPVEHVEPEPAEPAAMTTTQDEATKKAGVKDFFRALIDGIVAYISGARAWFRSGNEPASE